MAHKYNLRKVFNSASTALERYRNERWTDPIFEVEQIASNYMIITIRAITNYLTQAAQNVHVSYTVYNYTKVHELLHDLESQKLKTKDLGKQIGECFEDMAEQIKLNARVSKLLGQQAGPEAYEMLKQRLIECCFFNFIIAVQADNEEYAVQRGMKLHGRKLGLWK